MVTKNTPRDQHQKKGPTDSIVADPAAIRTTEYSRTADQHALVLRCALAVPMHRLFDYLPPKTFPTPSPANSPSLKPGIRIELPFGKGNRPVIGYLVELLPPTSFAPDTAPSFTLKRAHRILDTTPLWDPQLLQCLHWVSRYYHHPIGEVFAAALPKKLRSGGQEATHTPGYRPTTTGISILIEELKRSHKQQSALLTLREHHKGLSVPALRGLGIDLPTLKALQKKHLIEPLDIPKFQPPADPTPLSPGAGPIKNPQEKHPQNKSLLKEAPLSLNEEQDLAVSEIAQAFNRFQCFLLYGVTGSGKTEVYLQLIERLQNAQQTLVLVPEITLAPQTVKRFSQRFNSVIALYHSGLSDSEKLETWTQAKQGYAKIIIGTRSAAFLPFHNLGLIIVDEEHDPSFKQQDRFCYSARDVAIYRAQQYQIPIALGSATPSLESLHNSQIGRYTALRLQQRAGNSQPPTLRLIDIRALAITKGLSQPVHDKILETLTSGKQALIFINRRGYAPLMICHKCGHNFPCGHCDANLTVHKKKALLKCHHCLNSAPLPTQCPQCESTNLDCIGQGTERIEADIQALFPQFKTVRIDRDNIQTQAKLKQCLALLNSGEPVILVGTQMISKGHHFPNVTFVCIVDVDAGLFSIDFRASERLAQMMIQVAGRAGRAQHAGEVWLQTRQPDHPTLTTLLHQGYEVFAQQLLQERQQAKLPPFQYLALLRSESLEANLAKQFLENASEHCRAYYNHQRNRRVNGQSAQDVLVLGPVTAPMERRAGYSRFQLLLQANSRTKLHLLLNELIPQLEANPLNRQVRWRLDIDPLELY